jgi:hypothetical protein
MSNMALREVDMTSDGISARDWDTVHQAAVDVVNAGTGRKRATVQHLLRVLDELEQRYGRLPGLIATRADYVKPLCEREALYLEAFDVARTRRDVKNQRLVSHSLAEFYIEERGDATRGRAWLAEFRTRLRPEDKIYTADARRLTKALKLLESRRPGKGPGTAASAKRAKKDQGQ